ncbi:YidC/Oxa1 family membrane protein insertase [Streptococcus sp. zg-JUN1979]|uniref:YidC/Oxa1 family membrane protein insertase n=1 Tax=Streptococcus sp. zg-JUN1979 TaxID=3391450 RepID=UPI0039A6B676
MKKKTKLVGLAALVLIFLSACGRSDVTSQSGGAWERIVYAFASAIQWLSFGGSVAIGIILFTILLRTALMPLFSKQMASSQKMQELQPKLKELQRQYAGHDTDSRMKLAEASQALYKENGVNPYASFIPLLIQMPILWALYQALTRVSFLREGSFLWLDLAKPDPYFILPLLAAFLTFLSTWLTNKAAPEKNMGLTLMTYGFPILIFLFALNFASGVALYWTVSNAFQVFQIMLLNNPFKIIEKREAAAKEAKEREARIRRAKKKAHKKRK